MYYILEDANIKLSSVVKDVFGKSGFAILEALAEGQTDAVVLSGLAKGSLIGKKDQLVLALYGRFSQHHQFMLQVILSSIKHINQQIGMVEEQIDNYLSQTSNEVTLLQTIPGVSKQVAAGILSEIGTDMSNFVSYKHLASWAGVCPGNNESAGKKMSSRVTQGNKYLKTTLIESAWSACRSKNTQLAHKYYQMASRRGKKKAAMAIGHKILIAAYHILRDKVAYREPKITDQIRDQRNKAQIERLQKQLDMLKKSASNR